jgi:hypothetical protein
MFEGWSRLDRVLRKLLSSSTSELRVDEGELRSERLADGHLGWT